MAKSNFAVPNDYKLLELRASKKSGGGNYFRGPDPSAAGGGRDFCFVAWGLVCIMDG